LLPGKYRKIASLLEILPKLSGAEHRFFRKIMNVVILAGGFGTRISEESATKPKPMVEVGGRPILWHIMKIYSHYGLNDFIVCLGYKGYVIKEFFANYFLSMSNVRFDLKNNRAEFLNNAAEPWSVTLVDTGDNSLTGGRLRRVREFVGNETFCMTYGDGVTDMEIPKAIDFHKKHKGLATLTAVQPPGRFGAFTLHEEQSRIEQFREKPTGDGAWINGGFFVLEPKVLDYIDGDLTTWEKEPMQNLARDGQLHAYKYPGFWQSMDTLRDKMYLEELWASGKAPWKLWRERP
jgi:glucose-1-phosphate cytidylyltransferase